MPMLSVIVLRQSSQAWHGDERDKYDQPRELEPGNSTFTLPRDAGTLIGTNVTVKVVNDGPRSAWVLLGLPLGLEHPDYPRQLWKLLPAGEDQTYTAMRFHTVAEWVDWAKIYRGDGRDGQDSEREVFSLTYEFPGDTGATEWHHVVQGGSIVEPVEGDDASWTIASFAEGRTGLVHAASLPFKREYWASRLENRKL